MKDTTKETIPASQLCLAYWCVSCRNIIPKKDYHMKHPDLCRRGS